MKIIIFGTISLFILLLPSMSLAMPFLHDTQPGDNSFIGGGTKTISINITSASLNSSSVLLHVISLNAYQQGESWDVYSTSCVNSLTEWRCSKDISFAIAGSDTVELFYFDANDTDAAYGSNGTSSNPLRFTLDRNPPAISFVAPTNNSYVGGNKTISLTVTDASSGVNNNTVQYSTDNSQWTTMKNISLESFQTTWNTLTFSNNQNVTLYAKALDNIGNSFATKINVTVDNEIPDIKIISPLPTSLNGNAQLQVNVSDYFSGVDLANVMYTISSLTGTLGCAGNKTNATCTALLPTTSLQDNNYTLAFAVKDNAGNSNNASVEVKIKNSGPHVTITEPANKAFIKGTMLVKAALTNTEGTVTSVTVSIEKDTNVTTNTMTCDTNLTSCSYSLNTNYFTDDGYTIRVKALDTLNSDISSSIAVSIDNTKPSVNLIQPGNDVKGDFQISVEAVDSNLNQNKATFALSNFNGNLTCTPQTPSKYICSTTFNSKQLSDGNYSLNVSAEDRSGNVGTASKQVNIANHANSSSVPSTENPPRSSRTPAQTNQEDNPNESGGKGFFPNISLSFNSKYILLGIVILSVASVVIILAIVAGHRLGKSIITD